MQVRWTEGAANDLEHIADYLLLHWPGRAPRADSAHLRCAELAPHISKSRPAWKAPRNVRACLEPVAVRCRLRSSSESCSLPASSTARSGGREPSLRRLILRDGSGASRVRFAARILRSSRALDPPCAVPVSWQLPERLTSRRTEAPERTRPRLRGCAGAIGRSVLPSANSGTTAGIGGSMVTRFASPYVGCAFNSRAMTLVMARGAA